MKNKVNKKSNDVKNILKNQKGVTMIALVVMIFVMILIADIVIYNSLDSIEISNVKNMYSDIELLNSKVSSYYMQYDDIPVLTTYTNTSMLVNSGILGANDGEEFYVLDISKFESLSLYYGMEFSDLKSEIELDSSLNQTNINMYTDIYVINENSHNVYYIKGIEVDEKYYYSYSEIIDEVEVELVSIENISL